MERMKLVIAEGTEEFRLALVERLQGAYRVRACADGAEALGLICSFRPELVILDMMLPGLDGITILERCLEAGLRPVVLATTCFENEYLLSTAAGLGVAYMMRKPCDLRATVTRLNDLGQRIHPPATARAEPRVHVSNLLTALGFLTKWKGSRCLLEAVLLIARDPEQAITKELYPEVARRCGGGGGTNVERNMRLAIEKAWSRREPGMWRLYFPGDSRPSNAVFITRLADTLRWSGEPED